MTDKHIRNRNERILKALKDELVGPAPAGVELDCEKKIGFAEKTAAYGPFRQRGTGDEILLRDTPTKRYGVGVLYPSETDAGEFIPESANGPQQSAPDRADEVAIESVVNDQARRTLEEIAARGGNSAEDEGGELDLAGANAYRPSSMGISFLCELSEGATLNVKVSGGRYRTRDAQIAEDTRTWWLRSAVQIDAKFESADLLRSGGKRLIPKSPRKVNCDGLKLSVETFARPYGGNEQQRLITVCVVNRSAEHSRPNEQSLFQTEFSASIDAPDGLKHILPYPATTRQKQDPEEQSLELLYRDYQTFATGHGCAADWDRQPENVRVRAVRAECLPSFETASITPDIRREDGSALEVSMQDLAGLNPQCDGMATLQEVIERYEAWVEQNRNRMQTLDSKYRAAGERHLAACSNCATRMRAGLAYLQKDAQAKRAFQLANYAILLQQAVSRREPRMVDIGTEDAPYIFAETFKLPDVRDRGRSGGQWRAFQIAFLLMSLRSSTEGDADDRKTVELIWFPTGGGKTEAYLGLAAFSLFMRRLRIPADHGVHVLMRYTLRLLTAQQFQRASRLICAMEYLRRLDKKALGETPFSIGIWVGGSATPNSGAEAVKALENMKQYQYAENPLMLTRCPWCSAQMGPIKVGKRAGSAGGNAKGRRTKTARGGSRTQAKGASGRSGEAIVVPGYERENDSVRYYCPDTDCEFHDGLPVYVVDDDIYEQRPSLVIGTVDKFAMLAWRQEARALFGIGSDGKRTWSPPGLVIQDELHLISGPLGSMVGLYEPMIEELCTDRRNGNVIAPKIVSSTATIRRYEDQIKALYGRDRVALFPPPGLDAGDSFFARYATDANAKPEAGRIYVGVHAPGLGSPQTAQVRAFSALMQAPVPLNAGERDPWWTLMVFFNSLRELGASLSLFQADIPEYLVALGHRTGAGKERRYINVVKELTGRLRSDEVPNAIVDLEVACRDDKGTYPVDVCLASNILEVGIDIDRLSLMAVVGQPKTTAQYIQVTGRVGRNKEKPGLIVTVYNPTRPRDRSHFEKFRSYHERLYAQVEPTSVTPFSPPALDRALHAVMAAYVRQTGGKKAIEQPRPFPADMLRQLQEVMEKRVQVVDGTETETLRRLFEKRLRQWSNWDRSVWGRIGSYEEGALLRDPSSYVPERWMDFSWPTPTSMRSVDAECEAQITMNYVREDTPE